MTVEAIEKRREQVRLLEEELAKHSEALEARIREADKRDREFLERQEEFEREIAEKVAKSDSPRILGSETERSSERNRGSVVEFERNAAVVHEYG